MTTEKFEFSKFFDFETLQAQLKETDKYLTDIDAVMLKMAKQPKIKLMGNVDDMKANNVEMEKLIRLLEIKEKREKAGADAKTLEKQLRAEEKAMKDSAKAANEAAKAAKALEKANVGAEDSIKALRNRNKELREAMDKLSTSTKEGRKEAKLYRQEIDRNTKTINLATDGDRKRISVIGKYKEAFMGAIAAMGAWGAGIYAAYNALKQFIGLQYVFDKSLSKVKAIIKGTKEEMVMLEANFIAVGASSSKTANEVAQLAIELGKLGFTAKEINNLTGAIVTLSEVTDTDLAENAALVGAIVRGYGKDAEYAAQATDVMAMAFNATALDMSKFRESIKYVMPVLNSQGVTFERTSAMLGVLADGMIDSSMAGTSLRDIFSDLAKNGWTYSEAMDKIRTSSNQSKTAVEMFGKTSFASAIILANNTEKLTKFEKQLISSKGAAAEAAKVMKDNLAGDVTYLTSAWEAFILKMTDSEGVFYKVLRSIVKNTTEVLGSTDKLIASTGVLGLTYLALREIFEAVGNTMDAIKRKMQELGLIEKEQVKAKYVTSKAEQEIYDNRLKNIEEVVGAEKTASDAFAKYKKDEVKAAGLSFEELAKINIKRVLSDEEIKDQEEAKKAAMEAEKALLAEMKKAYDDYYDSLKKNREGNILTSIETTTTNTIIDKKTGAVSEYNINADLEKTGNEEIEILKTKLDREQELKDEAERIDTKRNEAMLDAGKEIGQSVLAIGQELLQFEIEKNQKELDMATEAVDAQKERVENQRDLADAGKANTLEADEAKLLSLQETEKKKRTELEKSQATAAKIAFAQMALDQAMTITKLILAASGAIAGSSTIPIVGVAMGLAAAASIIVGFIALKKQLKGLHDGTESVQGPAGYDNAGVFKLEKDERVISSDTNKKIPRGVKNEEIPGLIRTALSLETMKTPKELINIVEERNPENKEVVAMLRKIWDASQNREEMFPLAEKQKMVKVTYKNGREHSRKIIS